MNLNGNETALVKANNYITEEVRSALGARIFPPGSIVFPKVGGAISTNKKRKIVEPSCVDNNVMGLIPDSTVVDGDYLRHWMSGFDIYDFSNKANPPSITQSTVRAWPFVLPPLEEQKRIVAVLDQALAALDRARANVEANLADARALFGATVSSLSAQGSVIPRKPLRLGSIVTRLTNGYVGPIKNVYVDAGIPYLLARHVRNNVLAFDGKTFISPAFNEKHKKSKLKTGDVLLVQSGHIGHSAVVPKEHEGHNCHAMIVITPIDAIVSGPYLSMLFNTANMRERFEQIRSGSTVPHLTCKMVRELMLDIPPRAVQDQIIAQVAEFRRRIDEAIERYESDLASLAALRQSILHNAFAGELT